MHSVLQEDPRISTDELQYMSGFGMFMILFIRRFIKHHLQS